MNLTWQLVRKDIRRLAVPVLLWAAMVFGATLWFATKAWTGVRSSADAESWGLGVSTFAAVMTLIRAGLSYAMAGSLVLEDPLRGSTAFWQTRPITGGRLLLAKALAAGLLLVLFPTVMLAGLWLGTGFGVAEVIWAAEHFLLGQATAIVVAMTVASLSRSLTEFAFLSIGTLVAFGIFGAFVTHTGAGHASADLWQTRSTLAQLTAAAGVLGILAHQFVTRRTPRSWMAAAVAIVVAGAVGVAWPWSLPLGRRADGGQTNRSPEQPLGELRLERGAAVRSGARQTRVAAVELADDGGMNVLLVQREALPVGESPPLLPGFDRARQRRDRCMLTDRDTGRGVALMGEEVGEVSLAGYVIRVMRVGIPAEVKLRTWRNPFLNVIEVEGRREFRQSAATRGSASNAETAP